jgi:hypothetical protein
VDTRPQGGKVKTSLRSLALARAEKGPMSSKNLYYTLRKNDKEFELKKTILTAIKNNANEYLNPPITNIGYKGIFKTSSEIIKWFKQSKDIENDFMITAMLMEKAGTGGALFRNLYRDFLHESYCLIQFDKLKIGYDAFVEIASLWTSISDLFKKVSQTKDYKYIQQAADILKTISTKEKNAMEVLVTI